MKLVICKTINGWIIVRGDPSALFDDNIDKNKIASFNSIDKAISHIRSEIRSWHPSKKKSFPELERNM